MEVTYDQLDPFNKFVNFRFLNSPTINQYLRKWNGPWATLGGAETIDFVNNKYANQSDDWLDIQFHFISGTHVSNGDTRAKAWGFTKMIEINTTELCDG